MFKRMFSRFKNKYVDWKFGKLINGVDADMIAKESRDRLNTFADADRFHRYYSVYLEHLNEKDLVFILSRYITINSTGTDVAMTRDALRDHIEYIKLVLDRKATDRRGRPVFWVSVVSAITAIASAAISLIKN
jgi:septum formation topological specificity factor MinE